MKDKSKAERVVAAIAFGLVAASIWFSGVFLAIVSPRSFNPYDEGATLFLVPLYSLILWLEMDRPTSVVAFLNRAFDRKVIVNCDGDPYLHRWYVFQTRPISLFVHKFVRSDEDRALHDHPWPFLVIPIWRGYWEHSERLIWSYRATYETGGKWEKIPGSLAPAPFRCRVRPILGTRLRPATYRHRVELLSGPLRIDGVHEGKSDWTGVTTRSVLPAWSLFFHFRKVRVWGFWPKTGFVAWNKWWQDNKCG
jgi:hypothetical protein